MGYLTPDTIPGNTVCRVLFIPDDSQLIANVLGAIEALTFASNWTKQGAITPDEAAEAMVPMFDALCFNQGACRMIGELVPFAGETSPDTERWLACDGASLLRSDYPDLFAVIGTNYGMLDTDHFSLPDMRGRTPSGAGTGPGLMPVDVGTYYGEEDHVLTTTEMPSHAHSIDGYVPGVALTPGELPVFTTAVVPSTTGLTGGGAGHNTIGPRLGITWLIVAKT